MNYSFSRLNTSDFENMVQALAMKILGANSIVFGIGPDGARELTYEGTANFPHQNNPWEGYWVVQAKFKIRKLDQEDDFDWIAKNFKAEMRKFSNPNEVSTTTKKTKSASSSSFSKKKARKLRTPHNYLLFTNAVLTAKHEEGGRDKIEQLKEDYKNLIPNIHIVAYDELCSLLEQHRDIATAYASFILPGDILKSLFDLLNYNKSKRSSHHGLLCNYLEKEFRYELASNLNQGGKLTDESVNLENIFIDLHATEDGIRPKDDNHNKFIKTLVERGNYSSRLLRLEEKSFEPKLHPGQIQHQAKYVLVGGAGNGKSTLTQFACQLYRAFFLKKLDSAQASDGVTKFIEEYLDIGINEPICYRFPFKIVLKDYAQWISERIKESKSYSIIQYLRFQIEKIGDGVLGEEDLRDVLKSLSFIFVFDGLDEVPITSNRDQVMSSINDFVNIELRRAHADAIIIGTTRPQGYTSEFNTSSYKHLYITELSDSDCLKYLKKLLKNLVPSEQEATIYFERLKQALRQEVTGRLMRTPLQATIMTILVRSGGNISQMQNKYNLFKEYYEIIFKREKQKNIFSILNDYPRIIDKIHDRLGFKLQTISELATNTSSNVTIEEFKNFIQCYLTDEEEWDNSMQIHDFVDKTKAAITHRLVFITEVEENKVGFAIRSMQEYFASNHYVDTNDKDVVSRLERISQNAYWRNTLIFSVGNLHNNKSHLIEYVYAICHKLNGGEDALGVNTSKSITFSGSWLALDILIEGVFSDSVKNENKFSRLLENLFRLQLLEEHRKLAYLPDHIIQNYIIKFIEHDLSNQNTKISNSTTICGVLVNLYKKTYLNNEIIRIIETHFHEDDLKTFIEMMYDYEILDDFFLKKLSTLFPKHPLSDFEYLFNNPYEIEEIETLFKILKSILDNTAIEDKHITTKKVAEAYFLTNIYTFMYDNEKEYKAIMRLHNDFVKKLLPDIIRDYSSIRPLINILPTRQLPIKSTSLTSFYFEVTSIINTQVGDLTPYLIAFDYLGLDTLTKYILFIKNPTNTTLIVFFKNLNLECDTYYAFFNKPSTNWLFRKIFQSFPVFSQINNIISALEANMFGDTNNWLEIENEAQSEKNLLSVSRISNIRSNTTSNEEVEFINRQCTLFLESSLQRKDHQVNINFMVIFYNLSQTAIQRREKNNYTISTFPSIVEVIKIILTDFKILTDFSSRYYYLGSWIELINQLDIDDLIDITKKSSSLNDFWSSGIAHRVIRASTQDNVVRKIIQVLNISSYTNRENSIIKILLNIVYILNTTDKDRVNSINNLLSQLSYEDLNKVTVNNVHNKNARFLINLVNPNVTIAFLDELYKELESNHTNEDLMFKYLVQLITPKINKSIIYENFMAKGYMLYRSKFRHRLERPILVAFEKYLKTVSEQHPTYMIQNHIKTILEE